jgi:hypothetical protein
LKVSVFFLASKTRMTSCSSSFWVFLILTTSKTRTTNYICCLGLFFMLQVKRPWQWTQLVIVVFFYVANFEMATKNCTHHHGFFLYHSTCNTKTSFVRHPSFLFVLHILKPPQQVWCSLSWFFFFMQLVKLGWQTSCFFCVLQALKPRWWTLRLFNF